MKPRVLSRLMLVIILQIGFSNSKILRNNALMQKMISHFQDKPSTDALEQDVQQKPEKLLYVMQNVLCRNFPTIPCKVITQDLTLKNLIEKSIDQINIKKRNIEKSTEIPRNYRAPSVESNNFIPLTEDRYFTNKNVQTWTKEDTKKKSMKTYPTNEKRPRANTLKTNRNEYPSAAAYTRKNLRKFYPHKVKYTGKNTKKNKFDYSDEKISMSIEIPDMTLTKQHQHLNYKVEPADPPVWRIDYMKHGEPSFNRFNYQGSSLKDKIVKTGPAVLVDEHVLQNAARKDIMHPDVYIKKKFSRHNVVDNNSEMIES